MWLIAVVAVVTAKVTMLVEVCRHGVRSPLHFQPWDMDGRWPDGPGSLTATGMRQHYLLGTELRKRYPSLFHFNYTESLYSVVSTPYNRTIMSAQSQLLGLFPTGKSLSNAKFAVPPMNLSADSGADLLDLEDEALPNHFQPISIRTSDRFSFCPRLTRLDIESQTGSQSQHLIKEYSDVLEAVKSVLSCSEDEAVEVMRDVVDSVAANEFEGYSLPGEFNEKVREEMKELRDELFALSFSYENIVRLWVTEFFTDLANTLENVKNDNQTVIFKLYSAHDTTIAGILSGFERFDGQIPPFASSLLFEITDNSHLKVIYNDQVVTIPPCSQSECQIEGVVEYLRDRAYSDFAVACGVYAPTEVSEWKVVVAWLLLCTLLMGLLMAVAAVMASYKVTKRRGHLQEARDVNIQPSDR